MLAVFGQVLLHKLGLGLVDQLLLVLILLVDLLICVCGGQAGLMCETVKNTEDEGAVAQDLEQKW